MQNFEQKKQELINAFEQALNDWKTVQMDIFSSKTDDLDGSASLEENSALGEKLKSIKRDDYSSDVEYEKARTDLIRSANKNPNLDKRNEIEETMRDLFTQMNDLVSVYKNNADIDKLKKDNESKGY